ncbi:HPr family phosphocarrier protein [Raineyella fluvialis]|uniref:HPr family phosphocarrier protein n=1 Tax=Raineyella fluvialis TaxID=2662261 RepID=A0A5Q2F9J9_9ACTN|nr:HPr family phosphocarrier protein [Raineyella fluvialis]QGF23061.1 HPr family phosphocarrier protein [Raineyella fluvialis]
MIGIVVVSHSRPLADAAVALAGATVPTGPRPGVAIAAGIPQHDDSGTASPSWAFGTDAAVVAEAITSVDSPDGVLVLMDIGSAVMSAQLATEFLGPDVATHVQLCSAPLVEGLIAAVVTAAGGAPLARVAAMARDGLAAKQDLVGDQVTAGTPDPPVPTADDARPTVVRDLPVVSRIGLHLRPVARLVALAQAYDADVWLSNPGRASVRVQASDITELLALAATQGDTLRLEASGRQAEEAAAAIGALAASGFGDLDGDADFPGPSTAARRSIGE